jgi:hypothetical protein
MPCGVIVTVVASFRCTCARVRPAALRQRDQAGYVSSGSGAAPGGHDLAPTSTGR